MDDHGSTPLDCAEGRLLLQIVKDRGDPYTGMLIADIAANSQMPRDAVARLMEQLSNDGKVRQTRVCCFLLSFVVLTSVY